MRDVIKTREGEAKMGSEIDSEWRAINCATMTPEAAGDALCDVVIAKIEDETRDPVGTLYLELAIIRRLIQKLEHELYNAQR